MSDQTFFKTWNALPRWQHALIGITIVFAVFVVGFYVVQFISCDGLKCFSDKREDWAQFGDYVGGLLNPFISFLSLCFLVAMYTLQRQELNETRKILADQTNELQRQTGFARISAQEGQYVELMRICAQTLAEIKWDDRKGLDAVHHFLGHHLSADNFLSNPPLAESINDLLVALERHQYVFARYLGATVSLLSSLTHAENNRNGDETTSIVTKETFFDMTSIEELWLLAAYIRLASASPQAGRLGCLVRDLNLQQRFDIFTQKAFDLNEHH